MTDSLELVLVLLARSLHLPPVLGYLLAGVVFLRFSIGLEFSSDPQLY
jgi:predicted Kef-type K+ transport protein